MRRVGKVDRTFLVLTLVLVGSGVFIFSSASFGLLLKAEGAFADTAFVQYASIGAGLAMMYLVARVPLPFFKKGAPLIACAALIPMLLLLIPGWGSAHGGAVRWFSLWGISLQPGEFFKVAFVLFFAAWLAAQRSRVSPRRPFFIFLSFLIVAGALFLFQPDTDSLLILFVSACIMYAAAGFPWRHLALLALIALVGVVALFSFRPYVLDRVTVFLDPDRDPQGAGYQLQQSLIAIGSGGVWGKGFGQGAQKFEHLPEPTHDSIFAVFGEEFGLIGTLSLLLFFAALTLRGLAIAARAPDRFGMLTALGCTLIIAGAAFLNIASMIGLAPLSGLALPFISKGGSAMVAALIAAGLVLNVSRASALSRSQARAGE